MNNLFFIFIFVPILAFILLSLMYIVSLRFMEITRFECIECDVFNLPNNYDNLNEISKILFNF